MYFATLEWNVSEIRVGNDDVTALGTQICRNIVYMPSSIDSLEIRPSVDVPRHGTRRIRPESIFNNRQGALETSQVT